MAKGLYIPVVGEPEVRQFTALKDIEEAVQGFIQPLVLSGGKAIALINEEGRLEDLPINEIATKIGLLYDHSGVVESFDHIVGNMVIVGPINADGNYTDLLDDYIFLTLDLIRRFCDGRITI